MKNQSLQKVAFLINNCKANATTTSSSIVVVVL